MFTLKTYITPDERVAQMIERNESAVFTDPGGRLYAETADRFKEHGYTIHCLNFLNPDSSDGWNCMKTIIDDLDHMEEYTELFSETILSRVSDQPQISLPIFKDGQKSLLKALLLRVALGHDFQSKEKNIGSVYQLLQNPLGEEFLDSMFDTDTLLPEEKPCLGPYLAFRQAPLNLRGFLTMSLATYLSPIQSVKIRALLSMDGIDLHLPGERPCAYFCIFPPYHDAYKSISLAFCSMAAAVTIAQKPDVPVNILPDPSDLTRLPSKWYNKNIK